MRKLSHGFELTLLFLVLLAGIVLIWFGGFFTGEKAVEDSALYLYPEDAINYGDIRPPTAIVFEYMGKDIGQLEWGSGEFQFVGQADQSAKIFFEYFLRPYIDAYIEDELRRRKE